MEGVAFVEVQTVSDHQVLVRPVLLTARAPVIGNPFAPLSSVPEHKDRPKAPVPQW